jgi:hypothetical protein
MKDFLALMAILCPILSACSPWNMEGKVTDENGFPVNGATIIVIRTAEELTSDRQGNFRLHQVRSNDSIRISAPGFITATEEVNERGKITVILRRKPGGAVPLKTIRQLAEAVAAGALFRLPPLNGIWETLPGEATLHGGEGHNDTNQVRPLYPGDLVPDPVRSAISMNVAASDSSRWTLLVFWSTGCRSSAQFLKKLDTLQQQFRNISIVAVCRENDTQVGRFLSFRAGLHLNFVTGDTLLKKWFPFTMVPHVVWLSPGGRVEHITSGWEVSSANLEKVFKGEKLAFRLKKDVPHFRPAAYWLDGSSSPEVKGCFSHYVEGLPSGGWLFTDTATGTSRYLLLNLPAWSMLNFAWPDLIRFPKSRIRLTKGLAGMASPLPPEIDPLDRLYSYQLVFPAGKNNEAIRQIRADFDRILGIDARIIKKRESCLVLEWKNGPQTLRTEGEAPANHFTGDGPKWIRNAPLSTLVFYLNLGAVPVIDETGFKGRVDLALNEDLHNRAALNRALKKYGLRLMKRKRDINVFSCSESSEANFFSSIKTKTSCTK